MTEQELLEEISRLLQEEQKREKKIQIHKNLAKVVIKMLKNNESIDDCIELLKVILED